MKILKKRTELLTVDMVKENNGCLSVYLRIPSNTGYIHFNFSVRNDAKDSDNVRLAKKAENSMLPMMRCKRTLYH